MSAPPLNHRANPPIQITTEPQNGALAMGSGLPPVPPKLVAQIQKGGYVDMADSLPECMGTSSGSPAEGHSDSKKSKNLKH